MSVTIPAVIGINVPDPNISAPAASTAIKVEQKDVVSNLKTQVIETFVLRDNQHINLQTIVVL